MASNTSGSDDLFAHAKKGYDPKKLNAYLQKTKNFAAVSVGMVAPAAAPKDNSKSNGTGEEEEGLGQDEQQQGEVHQGGFKPKGRIYDTQAYVPKTPNGMVDIHPDNMVLRNDVFNKIRAVFRKHGAKELETPVCELKETLTGKYGEDSKLVYDLKDQGGELLSLRYDLTVPFARYLAQHGVEKMRRFHIARVYRRDTARINAGRFREFYQCDFDAAGVYEDMVPDSECVKIVSEVLEGLEFSKFGVEYETKINHRALLDGVFALCGVPADHFRQICSAVDKLDKEPWDKVRVEMVEKGLDEERADLIGKFVSNEISKRDLSQIEALCTEVFYTKAAPEVIEEARKQCQIGIAALKKLLNYVELMNVPMETVQFDMSMARGLDYYTGVIFEVILRKQGKGEKIEVGSVAGGGRYDNLVGMFNKKKDKVKQVPCVGISLGIERLITVLDKLHTTAGKKLPSDVDVFVGAIDAGGFESLTHRMKICGKLWDANVRAEFWHKKKVSKPNDQFEHCEKERIPLMIYFGSSEWNKGLLKIRKMFHDEPTPADGFVRREEVECSVDDVIPQVLKLMNTSSA